MPEHKFVIPFHVVLGGDCWVDVEGDEPTAMQLKAGDIVVFPKGDRHFMASAVGLRKTLYPEHFDPPPGRRQSLRYLMNGEAGGPMVCRFICGFIGCDTRPFNPLLGALPRMFRTSASDSNREWLAGLANAGVTESERDGAGAQTMLARLAELMFVEVLRQRIAEATDGSTGWLAGLRDPHVGASLELIHSRPAEPWTLEQLAQEIGLSRSVFSERFTTLVGMPAMQYLGRWRMTLAARLLEDPAVSLGQAGAEVGYESEAAFQRAFKKFVGTAPGAWRRTLAGAPVPAMLN
jgi:AraC-like DNA-binding protein